MHGTKNADPCMSMESFIRMMFACVAARRYCDPLYIVGLSRIKQDDGAPVSRITAEFQICLGAAGRRRPEREDTAFVPRPVCSEGRQCRETPVHE
jgi:hypothetical protein